MKIILHQLFIDVQSFIRKNFIYEFISLISKYNFRLISLYTRSQNTKSLQAIAKGITGWL